MFFVEVHQILWMKEIVEWKVMMMKTMVASKVHNPKGLRKKELRKGIQKCSLMCLMMTWYKTLMTMNELCLVTRGVEFGHTTIVLKDQRSLVITRNMWAAVSYLWAPQQHYRHPRYVNRTVGTRLYFCKNSHTARGNSNKSVQSVNNKIKFLCQVLSDWLFVTSLLRTVSIS